LPIPAAFRIPLIAFTSGADSVRPRRGRPTSFWLLPREQEACPHGLAPTTSTLMQLGAWRCNGRCRFWRPRGLPPGDFYTFHPGGQLGANARPCCRGHAHRRIRAACSVRHTGSRCNHDVVAAKIRLCRDYRCRTGRLIGIVTDGDVARNLGKNLVNQPIDAIMTSQTRRPLRSDRTGEHGYGHSEQQFDRRADGNRSEPDHRSASCISTICSGSAWPEEGRGPVDRLRPSGCLSAVVIRTRAPAGKSGPWTIQVVSSSLILPLTLCDRLLQRRRSARRGLRPGG
jgi:CBS domain-containing protein